MPSLFYSTGWQDNRCFQKAIYLINKATTEEQAKPQHQAQKIIIQHSFTGVCSLSLTRQASRMPHIMKNNEISDLKLSIRWINQ